MHPPYSFLSIYCDRSKEPLFERVLNTTEGINKPVRLHLYLAAEDGCAWTDFEGMLASLVKVMSDLQVYEGQAVRSYREEAAYPAAMLPAAEKASAPAEAQTASGSGFTFRNGLHWGMSPEEVLAAEGVSQFAYTKPISDRMMIQDLLVNLSKFISDGAYIFVDNRLVMTAFSIESSSADDAAYLAAALEQVYGPGTRGGALDSKLVRIVEFLGGTVDGVDEVTCTWSVQNGTIIQLIIHDNIIELCYLDTTADVDAALSTPTPEPLNVNGL